VEFLGRTGRGEDTENAFLASFGTTHEELANELRRYIEQHRFHYSLGKYDKKQEIGFRDALPMKQEDVLVRLGDLLAHSGDERAMESKEHFQQALKIDPLHAGARAGLGRIARTLGDLDGAVRHYEAAIDLDARDYLVHFKLAETLVRRRNPAIRRTGKSSGIGSEATIGSSDLERAREHYRKSIELNPEFAEAYIGYGTAILFSRDADLGAAIKLMEAGARLLPARSDVVVNLAILYNSNGDHEKARYLVDKVLPRMGDPEALEAAKLAIADESQEPVLPNTEAGSRPEQPVGRRDTGTPEDLDGLEPRQGSGTKEGWIHPFDQRANTYNEAVAIANDGDLKRAIAILERLVELGPEDELTEQARQLIEKMKRDAARLGMPLD
jgi:tetratricopeptide (TPR) repeat protein